MLTVSFPGFTEWKHPPPDNFETCQPNISSRREDLEGPTRAWVGPRHLQPECGDQGLKVGQGSWSLRIHSNVQLHLGLGPAFTSPPGRLLGKHWPCLFLLSPLPRLPFFVTSLISAAPRAPSAFSTGSGLSPVNSSAHSCDRWCSGSRLGGRLLGPAFLSPSVRILPRSCPADGLPSAFPSSQTRW